MIGTRRAQRQVAQQLLGSEHHHALDPDRHDPPLRPLLHRHRQHQIGPPALDLGRPDPHLAVSLEGVERAHVGEVGLQDLVDQPAAAA